MPIEYARGEKLVLRPIEAADAPLFVRWMNDPDVTQYLARVLPISMEEEQEWIKARASDRDNICLVIVAREGDRPVGSVGLHGISGPNRKAVFGISIGEKEFWNRGIGSEATEIALEIGFERLNLNRIELEVYESNPRAVRVYEKAGFVLEGVSRAARWVRGRFENVRRMAILADEWRARKSVAASCEVCQT